MRIVKGRTAGVETGQYKWWSHDMKRPLAITLLACLLIPVMANGADPAFTREEDVIYGRKYGTALTLDVFTPKANANGAAVVAVMSGGWFSAHEMISPPTFSEFLNRGYTVFAVVHGSNPKYTIPEAMEDMHRSIRFIRHHAKRFNIDPERIAIYGGSAGGHISLMIGTSGKEGDPKAKDPVDQASSRVQAVACWFPPTDFLNYGEQGRTAPAALEKELSMFKAPFDFTELVMDTPPFGKRFVLITDEKKRLEICKEISPVTHVSADDPPTLIIHGEADKLVPIQQSEVMLEKLKAAGVTAELIRRPGAGHGWAGIEKDLKLFADWFDRHLTRPATPAKRSE